MIPTPMPYVKFYTKIASSPVWRATPPNHRFVFLHLIVLAGANGTPGYVKGSDGDIAALLGCTRGVVTRAINRYESERDPSIIRTESGVKIANWGLYQAIPEDTRQDETKQEKKQRSSMGSIREDLAWWAELESDFPAIDILAEWKKARDWEAITPRKRHKKFFRDWVARARPNESEANPDDLKRQFPDGGWIG